MSPFSNPNSASKRLISGQQNFHYYTNDESSVKLVYNRALRSIQVTLFLNFHSQMYQFIEN